MNELDFMLINYELNRMARQLRRTRYSRRRLHLWVIRNIIGTLLGLGIAWWFAS